MATKAPDKLPPSPDLDALTAQRVFGWLNVHRHDGTLVGKKQDKAGHWRTSKVPHYSTDPLNAYAIDARLKQLGRSEHYAKELSRIATAKKLPAGWASPDQRCRAAIKAASKLSAVKAQEPPQEDLKENPATLWKGDC